LLTQGIDDYIKFVLKCLKNRGFTLIELVAVITLLMLLASLALPKYTEIVDKQRLKTDASTAVQLASIAETWYLENKTSSTFDVSKLTDHNKKKYMEELNQSHSI
jgi:prepilin-type N-terminal cleavage/methylation domain